MHCAAWPHAPARGRTICFSAQCAGAVQHSPRHARKTRGAGMCVGAVAEYTVPWWALQHCVSRRCKGQVSGETLVQVSGRGVCIYSVYMAQMRFTGRDKHFYILSRPGTSPVRQQYSPPPPRTLPSYSRGQPRGEGRPLPAACALRSPVPGGGECRKMETSRVCCTGCVSHHMVQARSSCRGHTFRDQNSMRCHCARKPLSIT